LGRRKVLKRSLKIAGIIIVILSITLIGLAIFARSFLTDERLRTLVVPRIEKAIGRRMELGEIQVSIFRGIRLKGLTVFEKDGKEEFFGSDELVLKYRLLPLLRREVVVDEIVMISPSIRIVRKADGKFNFDDLISGDTKEEKPGRKGETPLRMLIRKVLLKNASLRFTDEGKRLPETTARVGLEMRLRSLPSGEGGISYSGEADIQSVDTSYRGVSTSLRGKIRFDESSAVFDLTLELEDESVSIKGSAEDLASTPVVNLDISADRINMDRLMKSAGEIEELSEGTGRTEKRRNTKENMRKFVVRGTLNIGELIYHKMTIGNVNTGFRVSEESVELNLNRMVLAGGSVYGKAALLYGVPEPDYDITVNFRDIHTEMIAGYLEPELEPELSDLRSTLNGTVHINSTMIKAEVSAGLQGETISLKGNVRNYRRYPEATVSIRGSSLNLESVIELVNSLSRKGNSESKNRRRVVSKKRVPLFSLNGEIFLDKVAFKGVEMDRFSAEFRYRDERLILSSIRASLGGGKLTMNGKIDLRRDAPEYTLNASIDRIAINRLTGHFLPRYKDVPVTIDGKVALNKDLLSVDLNAMVFDNRARIKGRVINYLKKPDIRIDLSSDELDLDRLIPVVTGSDKRPTTGKKGEERKSGERVKMPFTSSGRISVRRVIYHGGVIRDFRALYAIKDNAVRLKSMTGGFAGGTFALTGVVDLNRPGYGYRISLQVKSVSVDSLAAIFLPEIRGMIYGRLDIDSRLHGSGVTILDIKRSLGGKGSITLRDGRFTGSELTHQLAGFFELEELRTIKFDKCRLDYSLKDGLLNMRSIIRSPDIEMNPKGRINILDETIDLEADLVFSEMLAKKLARESRYAEYIIGEGGKASLSLPVKVSGTLSSPRYGLDMEKLSERAIKRVKERLVDRIFEKITGGPGKKSTEDNSKDVEDIIPLDSIFKGIFGR
jgi:uncharacterized protein involved in outer membrane biogenesis